MASSLETILQEYKQYLEATIHQLAGEGQLPSNLLKDLDAITDLLDAGGSNGGGGSGASQVQIQAAIEAATNLTSVIGRLTQIVEAVDQIEPSLGQGSDAVASTATATASTIGLIKFLNQTVATLGLIRDNDNRTRTDVGRSAVVTGTANTAGGTPIPSTDCTIYSHVSVQLHGTWNAVVLFEGTNEGTNWTELVAHNCNNQGASSVTRDNGLFVIPLGFRFFRVRISSYTSGSVNAIAYFSGVPKSVANSNVSNTVTVSGQIAHDSSSSDTNPIVIGASGKTTNQRPVSENDVCRLVSDLAGRQIVHVGNMLQMEDVSHLQLNSTNETTLVASATSTRHVLQDLVFANLGTTACVLNLRDTTTGPVRMTILVPPQDMRSLHMHGWAARTPNTSWTVQATSANPEITISVKSYRLNY